MSRILSTPRLRGLTLLACLLMGGCATDTGVERVATVPSIDPAVLQALPGDEFIAGEFSSRNGTRIPYRLLAPAGADPDERYPLVLVLHGSGAIGEDNRSQLNGFALAWASPELRTRYPAYVLVPQFPSRSAEYDNAQAPQSARATPALSAALELVDSLVAERAIDPRRIYVTGFSMGGSSAWLSPLLRPDLFAAAMPVSGIAPDRAEAARLGNVPLWVLHGDADSENPIDSDRAMVARIRAQGGEAVRLREYEGLDHRIPGDVIFGTWWRDWLFAQKRPKPEDDSED
ncbi:esterase/PHB depolymerase [Luteimonas cucumeris]|uniref:Esterase/PHB depolymerase n=1 Tax=Luteimonas cucumeris TaxID=985012 RepID=A0A562LEF7_9GAMM|nr:PHB depolymerase family esterase [Luteimonas cucumeris]TWI05834.1 esterase/PHB depolymerase [Luteimonas cucumeris]